MTYHRLQVQQRDGRSSPGPAFTPNVTSTDSAVVSALPDDVWHFPDLAYIPNTSVSGSRDEPEAMLSILISGRRGRVCTVGSTGPV